MLISETYGFLFVKTVKTAGTSLEIEFSKLLSETDLVTPITPPHDDHRPRNHRSARFIGTTRGLLHLLKSRMGGPELFWNHMSAASIRERIGAKRFASLYKFCVEREPVDKCISHFSMYANSDKHRAGRWFENWDDYVEQGRYPIDFARYTSADGRLMVDRICRFERLEDELAEISERLGMPFAGLKATAKKGWREEIKPTDKQIEQIYEAFAATNNFTGYSLADK